MSLPSIDTIEAAIERAVEFIARAQQADGEVAARRHDTPDLSDAGELDPSNFATSFALYAMEFSAHPLAREVERRARALLMKEALGPGIWRYSAQRLTIPIDRMLPLSDAAEGHAAAEKGGIGKILLLA